jgi:hypothetical protein
MLRVFSGDSSISETTELKAEVSVSINRIVFSLEWLGEFKDGVTASMIGTNQRDWALPNKSRCRKSVGVFLRHRFLQSR